MVTNKIDIASYGAALDGVTPDTAAFQAAIDRYAGVGATITMSGVCLLGELTWPANIPYRLEVTGEIKLTEGVTFTIPALVDVIGRGGAYTSQFSSDGTAASIRGSETSNPVVRVIGSRGKTLENIVIQPPKYVGLEVTGAASLGALLKMRNVSCTARTGVAASQPFVSQTFFWLDMQDCSFMGMTGSHPYPVEFRQDATTGAYSGLIRAKGLRLNANGIKISSTQTPFSADFVFEDAQLENGIAGANLLEIDNQTVGVVGDIRLIRPRLFDSIEDTCILYVTPSSGAVRRVAVEGADLNQTVLRPTSGPIQGLSIEGYRPSPYTSPISGIAPSYIGYKRSFATAIDARIVNAPRTPSVLPVAPLAVEQDPALWSALASGGATVTTGIRAPDGTLTAGQVGGTNGGLVKLCEINTVVALGDHFIAGIYLQTLEAGKMPANARIDLATGGWHVNGTNSTVHELGRDYEPMAIADNAWKWVCEAIKITAAGSGNALVRYYLRRDTVYGITNCWMPCLLHIPASLGFSDADVAQYARSLTAWPSVGGAGRFALPRGVHLQLDMTWDGGHLIDAAGNETWQHRTNGKWYTKLGVPSSETDGTVIGPQSQQGDFLLLE